MIHDLKAENIQGIDVVIYRYQQSLQNKLAEEWDIYPRLEQLDDEWRYYLGKGNEHKTVDFSEQRNMIGFGVGDITLLGNQSRCDLIVIVSTQKIGNTRDIQSVQSNLERILKCTFQTTPCTITRISPSTDQRGKQPSIDFTITIEANFIPSYNLA